MPAILKLSLTKVCAYASLNEKSHAAVSRHGCVCLLGLSAVMSFRLLADVCENASVNIQHVSVDSVRRLRCEEDGGASQL